jgi:hypothetical protein
MGKPTAYYINGPHNLFIQFDMTLIFICRQGFMVDGYTCDEAQGEILYMVLC